jgi:aspartate-semialdehyde dehydrogenase
MADSPRSRTPVATDSPAEAGPSPLRTPNSELRTGFRTAIVGATGLVGATFRQVLEQRDFPVRTLGLFASDRSSGRELPFKGASVMVEDLARADFSQYDIVFGAADAPIAREFVPAAAAAGALVIDNSSAFRMDPDVPLVVPEVNLADARTHRNIIANPNCSTIQLVVTLWPLHQRAGLRRLIVDTYQAASGTGAAAVAELRRQTPAVLNGEEVIAAVYPHPLAFNVIPQRADFTEGGVTTEEVKVVNESRKIMHLPDLRVAATCVSVPTEVGHGEAVHVEFERPLSPAEARAILAEAPGVVVQDDPAARVYPMPLTAAGRDPVFVGRIHEDGALDNGLSLWIVADNLRKGAALNAVQIAEHMIHQGWI